MTTTVIASYMAKGGIGKTTVAMCVAGCLARRGQRVVVIDADPKAHAAEWYRNASDEEPFPALVHALDPVHAERELQQCVRHYSSSDAKDFVVIDCPSELTHIPTVALARSHLVLLPYKPCPMEYAALQKAEVVLEAARRAQRIAEEPEVEALVVPNMYDARKRLHRDFLEVAHGDLEIPVARVLLRPLTVFEKASANGLMIHDVEDPRAQDAAAQIELLTDEILERLQITSVPPTPPTLASAHEETVMMFRSEL